MQFNRKENEEGGNLYDVLYIQEKFSKANQKDYDTSGNRTGIQISKGILNEQAGSEKNMSAKMISGAIKDIEGHIKGEYANHAYEVKSDKESLALMNFLDKNTTVEWSNTLMKSTEGRLINLITTSHDENTIKVESQQLNKYIKGPIKHEVIRADHIHPTPGKIGTSQGDEGNAADILLHSPNAIFRILNQGRYYPYKAK